MPRDVVNRCLCSVSSSGRLQYYSLCAHNLSGTVEDDIVLYIPEMLD